MSKNSFSRKLQESLDFSSFANDPYGQSYAHLKQICASIEDNLNNGLLGRPIKIEIEPGFNATIGQQLKIIIRIPDKHYRDTLFRAYVPVDGFPITLDLYGEDAHLCKNQEELELEILNFLLYIKDRMASYRDYASK